MDKVISIVTISYNQAKYLPDCINSILNQKQDFVEYILVDPGSSDGSREIIEHYSGEIDYLVLEPDSGPADGLNKGFSKATGEIGYFLNSDDLLLPGAIEKMMTFWRSNPAIDILFGGAWMIDERGEPTRELTASINASLDDFLTDRAVLVQQGMSFRLPLFKQVRGFNELNRTCWDYELVCRMLAEGGSAIVVPDRFGAFRLSGDNISSGIGGDAHTARFREDKARIFHDFKGEALPRAALSPLKVRAQKFVHNLPHEFRSIADRAFPSRMKKRWIRDHQKPL